MRRDWGSRRGLLAGVSNCPAAYSREPQLGLGEAVVDRAALRPVGDQARLLQPGQVGGDVGLGATGLTRSNS
jgi:hypothetical protein